MTSPVWLLRTLVITGVLLAACAPGAPTPTVKPTEAPKPAASPAASPSPSPSPSPVAAAAAPAAAPAALPPPGSMPAGSFMRQIQDRGKLTAGVKTDALFFGYLNPRTNK